MTEQVAAARQHFDWHLARSRAAAAQVPPGPASPGSGISAGQRQAAMGRDARLDESVPGSGLGLAIVHVRVGLYGGRVTLGTAARGGLRVEITLPGAAGHGAA